VPDGQAGTGMGLWWLFAVSTATHALQQLPHMLWEDRDERVMELMAPVVNSSADAGHSVLGFITAPDIRAVACPSYACKGTYMQRECLVSRWLHMNHIEAACTGRIFNHWVVFSYRLIRLNCVALSVVWFQTSATLANVTPQGC
jgi:hypothetical protein